MGMISHAESEMAKAWPESEEMQDMVKANVMELLKVLETQGHSGMSLPYVLSVFNKLAKQKPLSPLTGEDDEWMEVGPEVYQNIRCGSIFKKGKFGQAYWLDGVIFRDQNGHTFTNGYSRTPVQFPYTIKEPTVIDIYQEG